MKFEIIFVRVHSKAEAELYKISNSEYSTSTFKYRKFPFKYMVKPPYLHDDLDFKTIYAEFKSMSQAAASVEVALEMGWKPFND